jgi:hypothetical protein
MPALLSRFDHSTGRVLALAAVTFVTIILAAWAVIGDASKVRPAIDPRPMFPDLDVAAAASLTIQSPSGEIEIVTDNGTDWTVPARDGYPARRAAVVQTVGGLADLELIEAKTARADWHHFLGLVDPGDGGEGVKITLRDGAGEVLADVIVGNQPEGAAAEPDGRGRIHVRRPGNDQTWLARGSLSLHTDVAAWLATHLYDIDADRVREARVTPVGGEAYTLSREAPGDSFVLGELPVGREILSPYVIEAAATALTDMEVEDVRPESDVDLAGGFQVVYRTFDGLEVTFNIADPEGADAGWATILARFTGLPDAEPREAAAVAEEAANINVLADGWAFQLPSFQARQMTLHLTDLLRPLPGEDTAQP